MTAKLPASLFGGLTVSPEALEALSDEEREAIAQELAQVNEAFKANPLLGYRPHPKQRSFHRGPWPRTRLFIGGNRSGKTTATVLDTIVQCIDPEAVPKRLRPYKRFEPPAYIRMVGPDLTRWLDGVALQTFRKWCPRDQLHGKSMERAWDKQQLMLRFRNGSWIQFMSNDQDVEKFAGSALHRVVFDESPRQDIRAECRMRLIDFGGEELFGLTPMDGMSNWLYDEFYEPWERGVLDEDLARLVLVDMDDNPHLAQEDKDWALEGLGPEEKEARKTGRFITFSGLIYPEFRTHEHVVPSLPELPEGVEVFAGIDPGYRHMCAVIYAYLDTDDTMVIFDEIAMPKALVSEVCREIALRNERWGTQPRWFVIDPSARNKNSQTGRSDQQEFEDHGVFTLPGQNDVRAGINHVKERLAAGKLKVTANCSELQAEFKKYRWMRDSGRSEHGAKEQPVKRDDHCLNATRYIAMARPMRPERDLPRKHESTKDRMLRHHLKRLRRPAPAESGFGPGIFR